MARSGMETDKSRSTRIPTTSRGARPVRSVLARSVVARFLAVLMILVGLSALGPGAQAAPVRTTVALAALTAPGGVAASASGCSGRPAKTLRFATGELRVYKNHRYACAVTIAKRPGVRRTMSVSLQPRGGRPVVDRGHYHRKAGPVTVHALNRCIRASGKVAGVGRSTGWILC